MRKKSWRQKFNTKIQKKIQIQNENGKELGGWCLAKFLNIISWSGKYKNTQIQNSKKSKYKMKMRRKAGWLVFDKVFIHNFLE